MRYILLLIAGILCVNNDIISQNCSLVSFNALPNAGSVKKIDTVLCRGNCLKLYASLPVLKQTTAYSVASIPYVATLPCETGGTIPPGFTLPDDNYSGVIPMNFNFCFYGNSFSNVVICDNGFITFSTNKANVSGASNVPWNNRALPNLAPSPAINSSSYIPHNSICGAMMDVLIPPSLGGGGTITTQTIGTAPYRAFIVKYNNCRYYNCNTNPTIVLNMKIVLYETTNMIDVYIGSNPACGAQAFTQGIQGNNASQFLVTPGRNGTVWNGAGTAYRYTPNGANYPVTLNWFKGASNVSIGTSDTLNVCPTEDSATYRAVASLTSVCPSVPITLTDSIKVRTLTPSTVTNHVYDTLRCVDSFQYDGFKLNTLKYKWDNLSTSRYRKIGASGNYYVVRFMDSMECQRDTLYFHIVKNAVPKIDSVVFSGCFNTANSGSAIIYASGDTSGAIYGSDTNNLTSNKTISNIGYGTIKLWVKNSNGCKVSVDKFNDSLLTSVTRNNVACVGDTSGRLRLATTGGVSPYSFKLNGGASQSIDSFVNLTAGVYSLQVTDKIGCVKTVVDTVKIVSNFVTTFVLDTIKCYNGNDGKITINCIGGILPYRSSVNYSAYNTTMVYNSLGPGSYYVRVKDNNNCLKDTTLNLTNPPQMFSSYTFDSSCTSVANGTISVSASGGRTPYTYKIDANSYQSSNIFNNLSSGTYLVSIKDASNCIKDSNITIGVRPQPIVSLLNKKNVQCYGGSDGKIKISASNGTSPYSFNWSNGTTLDSTINLSVGTYSLITTDSKGCKDTSTYPITAPDSLLLTITPTHLVCNSVNNGLLKLSTTGGVPAYKYSLNNTLYQYTDSFTNMSAGTYTVYVKDSNLCVKSKNITLTQPNALQVLIVKDSVNCFGGNTGKITLTPSGGTPSFKYSLNNTTYIASNVFNSLTANTYNVKIKDTNNCTLDTNVTITQSSDITVSNTITKSCKKISNGTITVTATGGKAPYTYSLNSGSYQSSNVFSNVASGTYSVNVKDALNCIKTVNAVVDTFSSIITSLVTKKNVSCYGFSDGKIKIAASSGTAPYTYAWSNSGTLDSIINLGLNTYTVIVTDAKACKDTQTYTITMPDSITMNVSAKNPLCNGDANGKISTIASGATPPFLYSKDNITYQSADSFVNLGANTYTVFVKDNNQCLKSKAVTLTQPNVLTATYNKDSVSCYGGSNGVITAISSGGTSPYKFSLNNGTYSSTNVFSGLTATSYNVKIKDTNNCTLDSNIVIKQYDSLVLNTAIDSITCKNYSNGKITATTSGGAAPYQYSINGGSYSSASVFSNLSSGTYTISVKDIKNCTKSKSVTIINPSGMTNSVNVLSDVLCYGSNEGKAKALVTGGTPPYSILWKNGSTVDSATNIVAGTHYVKITDFKGCKDSLGFTIIQPDSISATFNLYHPKCFNTTDGAIKVNTTGGTSPYSFKLNALTPQSQDSFSSLIGSTYLVNIKDANNCSKSYSKTLITPTPIVVNSILVDSVKCNGNNTGKITLNATGGTPSFTYKVNGTSNANNIYNNLVAGSYVLKITDANACQLDTTVNVYQYPVLSASLSLQQIKCYNQNIGKITVTPSGGNGSNYSYSLNLATYQSSNIYSNLAKGTYSVRVKDANSCEQTYSAVITQPDSLTLNTVLTHVKCFGDNTGKIKLTSSGGVVPYDYSFNSNPYSTTDSLVNLVAGNYTVTLRDSNQCVKTQNISITQPPKLIVSLKSDSVICYGTNTGSFKVPTSGGVTPYYYSLNTTTFVTTDSFSGLFAGTFPVRVKDANGCIKDTTVEVYSPDSIKATLVVDSIKCYNESNGQIAITPSGGNAPYTYSLNSASPVTNSVFSNLPASTYQINVIDRKLCSKTYNVTLLNQPKINIVLDNIQHNLCFGDALGSIKVTATGGRGALNYQWSHGATTSTISNLISQAYTLTVVDAKNCKELYSNTITQPAKLSLNFVKNNLSCYNDSSGTLLANPIGGVSPYTYSWSQGSTSSTILQLKTGNYIVTITDANSCVKIDSALVTEPAPISYKLNITNSNCLESNNGEISITNQIGGTPAYTYLWSNGATTSTISSLQPLQNYKVTVSDSKNCKKIDSGFIDTLYVLRANIVFTSPKCPKSEISITINPENGASTYDYYLGTIRNQTGIFTKIIEDIYTIKVVDGKGCTFSKVEDMRIKDPMVTQLINYVPYCTSANTWSSKLNVTGGEKPYTFNWPGALSVINGDSAVHNKKGNYIVEVRDFNNCLISLNFTLDPPDSLISAEITSKKDLRCYQIPEGEMVVTARGGTPPYHYKWSNGDTLSTAKLLKAHTFYNVTAYDSKGCLYQVFDTLSEPDSMKIKYKKTDELCIDSKDGTISLSASGGTSPLHQYTYSIDNISYNSDNSFSFLAPKTYTVYYRDQNLCIDSTQINIAKFEPFTSSLDSIYSYKLGEMVVLNPNVVFSNPLIQNTVTYQWTPSDGLSCSDCATPICTKYNQQDYTLLVKYNDKCESKLYTKVRVSGSNEEEFYIPNAFSPNGEGDADNETFKAYGNHVKTFNMMVYNRWGEKLFESDNISKGWDGSFKGQAMLVDIYVYKITATFLDGRTIERKGSFKLVR